MIATIKIAFSLMTGCMASVVVGTDIANANLGPDTQIGLGVAVACVGVLLTCTLWLASYYWRQNQMHKENIRRFKRIERALKVVMSKQGIAFDLEEDADSEE
jgi:hypothetical protein